MEALTPWAADGIDKVRHRAEEYHAAKSDRSALEAVANAGGDRWNCRSCGYTICNCGPKSWDAVATAFWVEAQENDVEAVLEALEHVKDDAMTADELHDHLVAAGDCEYECAGPRSEGRAPEVYDAAAELWVMVREARGKG